MLAPFCPFDVPKINLENSLSKKKKVFYKNRSQWAEELWLSLPVMFSKDRFTNFVSLHIYFLIIEINSYGHKHF